MFRSESELILGGCRVGDRNSGCLVNQYSGDPNTRMQQLPVSIGRFAADRAGGAACSTTSRAPDADRIHGGII